MKGTNQKVFTITGLLITLSIIAFLTLILRIIYSKYQNRENFISTYPTLKTNSFVESVNTSIHNALPPNEDEDVFEQRQLRADSNNSSAPPKY